MLGGEAQPRPRESRRSHPTLELEGGFSGSVWFVCAVYVFLRWVERRHGLAVVVRAWEGFVVTGSACRMLRRRWVGFVGVAVVAGLVGGSPAAASAAASGGSPAATSAGGASLLAYGIYSGVK